MKTILVIENDFCRGGREKVTIDILEMLVACGKYKVDLCLIHEGGEWDNRIPKGVNLVNIFDLPMDVVREKICECDQRYSLAVNLRKGYFFRSAKIMAMRKYRKNRALRYRELYSHVKQDHYDYVIASSLTVVIVLAIAAQVNADCKYVWWHNVFCKHSDRKKFGLDKNVTVNSILHDVNLYSCFDKIICVSDKVKELFDYYFPYMQNKSVVMYNAIDEEKIKQLADIKVNDIPNGKIKIATVGRISKEKGQQLAIEAAKILKKHKKEFVWYFVGNGDLLIRLKRKVQKEHLEPYCIFLGARDNPYPYIKACDIYCQPSLTEAYCTTINEARIIGKAIVATRFTGIVEQKKKKKNGLICDTNAKMLAGSIEKLFDKNYLDKLSLNVEYPNETEKGKIFSVEGVFD